MILVVLAGERCSMGCLANRIAPVSASINTADAALSASGSARNQPRSAAVPPRPVCRIGAGASGGRSVCARPGCMRLTEEPVADGRVRSSRILAGRGDFAHADITGARRIPSATRTIHLLPLLTSSPLPVVRRTAPPQPVDRGRDRASRGPPGSWVLIERGPQMHNPPARQACPRLRR